MDYLNFSDELPNDYRLFLDGFVNLSREEEVSLCQKAAAGDLDARNDLVMSFQKFLLKIAYSFLWRAPSLELMDLIQSGNMGLIKASEKFDPSIGVRFSTYAAYWIRQALISAVQESRMIRLPEEKRADMAAVCSFLREHKGASVEEISLSTGISLKTVYNLLPHIGDIISTDEESSSESLLPPVEDNCLNSLVQDEQIRLLKHALESLPPRQRAILKAHYGVFGEEIKSLSMIAASCGISKERARQIELQAMEGCRAYFRRSA
ncbi:MAG: sigma-70 family RNA polymerase sigma factor [Sphaerochaetaceae bacterium]|nr:sigma-70 family RNA polymerase sigma factor [Sphaerochaetaceae bacterium]